MLYRVTKAGWLTDSRGEGAFRSVGEALDLTEAQAGYLRRAGQVEATPKPTPEPVPPARSSARRRKPRVA